MIEITEVRVSLRNDEKLKAFVSITLNDSFVVRGLKIIHGNSGLFVAMPSRKRPDGQHQDLAHPINDVTRKYLTEKVMAEYERELSMPQAHAHHAPERGHDGHHDFGAAHGAAARPGTVHACGVLIGNPGVDVTALTSG